MFRVHYQCIGTDCRGHTFTLEELFSIHNIIGKSGLPSKIEIDICIHRDSKLKNAFTVEYSCSTIGVPLTLKGKLSSLTQHTNFYFFKNYCNVLRLRVL